MYFGDDNTHVRALPNFDSSKSREYVGERVPRFCRLYGASPLSSRALVSIQYRYIFQYDEVSF